jgi:hypothetical protein
VREIEVAYFGTAAGGADIAGVSFLGLIQVALRFLYPPFEVTYPGKKRGDRKERGEGLSRFPGPVLFEVDFGFHQFKEGIVGNRGPASQSADRQVGPVLDTPGHQRFQTVQVRVTGIQAGGPMNIPDSEVAVGRFSVKETCGPSRETRRQ